MARSKGFGSGESSNLALKFVTVGLIAALCCAILESFIGFKWVIYTLAAFAGMVFLLLMAKLG
jgi:hypothetical protein